jgi:hypothetical protein
MTIARQRFDKHVLEVKQSTVEEPPLLGSKSLARLVATDKTYNNRRIVRGDGLSSDRSDL